MGVAADEQRTGGALRGPVLDDRLRGGQDVRLVERRIQAGPPMPRRPERHLLVDVLRVGHDAVVGGDHLGHVDEVFGLRRLSGAGIGRHGTRFCPSAVRGGWASPRIQIDGTHISARPAAHAATDTTSEPTALASASIRRPCCTSRTVSKLAVLKVV